MSSRPRSLSAHAARAALVVMLAAPALGAQQPASPDSAASLAARPAPASTERAAPADTVRSVAGAPMIGAAVAVRAPTRGVAAAPTVAAPGPLRQSQVLMIVGGAAVVLGLVAGGDAEAPLVVGGAIIGLFGLYQYLK